MDSKAYLFLAEGFEEIEGLTVVDLLRRAGMNIITVSIEKELFVTGAHQIITKADMLFEDTDYQDAQLLVLPGGMPGTNNLLKHQGLDQLLREFNKAGKWIAAICAAPKILGQKGILEGKKAICYPGVEQELKGAIIVGNDVVEDGNIITSRAMGTAIDFSLHIIKRLKGEAQAQKIADAICYKHYNNE